MIYSLRNIDALTAVWNTVCHFFTRRGRIFLALLLLLSLNSNVSRSQIVINEIGIGASCPSFFNCNDAGGGGEFIELFNKSGCTQNIGCYVLVYSGPSGAGWSVTIPSGITLSSGQYYLIGGHNSNHLASSSWTNGTPGS